MNEDIPLPFDLPAVARKKVSTAFDGGRIIPKAHALATAEFATIRLRLLKLGARVIDVACVSASRLPLPAPTPL
jgi:hypothetical protein